MKAAYWIGLWIACYLIACESPLTLELPPYTPTMVVQSSFLPNQPLEVVLSTDRPIDGNQRAPYISNATISLFENGDFVEVLNYVPSDASSVFPPYYESTNTMLKPNSHYLIQIVAPGFETVTAQDSIPSAVNILEMRFESSFTEDELARRRIDFQVEIDLPNLVEAEYFHLRMLQNITGYRIDPNGNTVPTPGSDSVFLVPFTASEDEIDFVDYLDNQGMLFTDRFFSAGQNTLRFSGTFELRSARHLADDFVVELRKVSESYYQFHKSVALQFRNQADPLATPIILNGNIENGFGTFVGFQVDTLNFGTIY